MTPQKVNDAGTYSQGLRVSTSSCVTCKVASESGT